MMAMRMGMGMSAALGSGAGAPTFNIIGVAIETGAQSHTRIDVDGNTLSGTQYDLGGSYYDAHGAFAFEEQTVDGQTMIRIPAMYYKRAAISGGDHDGKQAWWVSDGPADGFVLHPAFYDAGSPVDQIWIGKYEGVSDAGGTKVGSFGGTTPLVSINQTVYRSRCEARNAGGVTGFGMMSIYQIAVVQMLAMIETALTDSQAALGNGRVSQSSAANVDAADVAQAAYRGLVGLWGNVWHHVDGYRTDGSGNIELWDRTGGKTWIGTATKRNFASFVIGTGLMLGVSGTGFDFGDVFVVDTQDTVDPTWVDGIIILQSASRVCYHGGNWNDGADAGLWAFYGAYVAGIADASIGGRLAKV